MLGLLAITTIVIIVEYLIRRLISLVGTGKKLLLKIIEVYYEIKASKQAHNPLHQQIQQKDSHNHQFQSNQSLPYLLHRNNILKQKRKAKGKKGSKEESKEQSKSKRKVISRE